jgi:maleate isomerase
MRSVADLESAGNRAAPVGPRHPTAVGVIVPYDMALDHELWRWAPEGVSLLFTRTPYSSLPVTIEMAQYIGEAASVKNCVQDLMCASPAACAYACTAGSFVAGVAGERALVQTMRDAGASAALTTSGAVVEALAHLGARRVAIATPYDPEVTERLRTYLKECGVDVVASSYLGLTGGIWQVPYVTTARLVTDADDDDADAVFVSCTNLPTYDLIAPLEAKLRKPVITANQATMWAAMRALGRDAVGPGQRLLT